MTELSNLLNLAAKEAHQFIKGEIRSISQENTLIKLTVSESGNNRELAIYSAEKNLRECQVGDVNIFPIIRHNTTARAFLVTEPLPPELSIDDLQKRAFDWQATNPLNHHKNDTMIRSPIRFEK